MIEHSYLGNQLICYKTLVPKESGWHPEEVRRNLRVVLMV